jgi:ribosome biogenesis protein ENP2
LNLEQGRFLSPLNLGSEVSGVNVVDINPAHQLLAFGLDGEGTVQFWDPRSRSSVGALRLPKSRLTASSSSARHFLPGIDNEKAEQNLSVTALASRTDGLSYAVGTSTGHTLLYDIRSAKPFATKDQGYGLPIKSLSWIDGSSRMAGDGMVLSADSKVIKVWQRDSVSEQTSFQALAKPKLVAALNKLHIHYSRDGPKPCTSCTV